MRSDRVPVRLVSLLSSLPASAFDDPVIDLVDWRIDALDRGTLADRTAPVMVVLRVASFALDRIIEIAGRITLRGAGARPQVSLPVSCLLAIAPGQQRSIILEVTDRATIKTLHALSEQRAKAELKVAHVVYEDGSIEEFGH